MPEQKRPIFGPLRPWVAPAFGAGLVTAGVAMAAGMSAAYGPTLGVVVAAVILLFGHRRVTRGNAKS